MTIEAKAGAASAKDAPGGSDAMAPPMHSRRRG